ncbi:MAG TPA: RcnB family protein [Acidocella sp.]|jgi:Ni/Co efflux regulator RcnB|uniref:RcnB family protein n=1 Tax=Acidocella sp. TaxID=50710 RepID=UPI002BD991AC|nr:RcnB family protein [Acidocella sp.]HVE21697.1 RcnB family protein [Acidocella sp.]
MKRISLTALSAGLGLALLAAPLAMAQQWQGHPSDGGYDHHQMEHPMGHEAPHMAMAHQWRHGDRFTGHREVVSDWDRYHVRRPPAGYEWVHDGNQLVMIAIGTGLVASALANGY